MSGKRYKIKNKHFIHEIETRKSSYWENIRDKNKLKIFKDTVASVPAYRLFLKKHSIDPKKIRTIADLAHVPVTTKDSYLRSFSVANLCKKGTLMHPLVFTATSGSTGEPYYFPRFEKIDREYSILIEYYLSQNKISLEGPTLVVVCFGMGIWIGGVITYQAFEAASRESGYPISIITPGTNKEEVLNSLAKLAPNFSQTILIGYPPFIKDLIDEAASKKINLSKLNMRLMFAAESFSEKFRDYLGKKAKIDNIYRDTLNVYGSADIGAMAWETGVSILIKRILTKDKKLYADFFPSVSQMPTMAQYNPHFITFESVDGNIILSAENALPLVRYAIGDHGGAISFREVEKKFKKNGYDLKTLAKKAGITSIPELPFVYIYERSDFSTKFYGAIVFPEYIKSALERDKVENLVTGKFTMFTRHDKKHNQFLEVNVELKKGIHADKNLNKLVQNLVFQELIERSTECRNNAQLLGKKMLPKITFWSYEDSLYFKTGIKQKWVKKTPK
ncbi:MAG: phenylacetate--CoA ligase family protein [Patescibacteria group bacterium]|nr:phenylacetate--CoA ligase family protein [Patescibacteria group bacterium]